MRMSSPILLATELNEGERFPVLPVENQNESELWSASVAAQHESVVVCCTAVICFCFVVPLKNEIAMTTTNENVAPLHEQTRQSQKK